MNEWTWKPSIKSIEVRKAWAKHKDIQDLLGMWKRGRQKHVHRDHRESQERRLRSGLAGSQGSRKGLCLAFPETGVELGADEIPARVQGHRLDGGVDRGCNAQEGDASGEVRSEQADVPQAQVG